MIEIITDEHIYDAVFEKTIKRAQRSLWIATANVKNAFIQVDRHHTGSFLELMEELAARGVEIRILHSGVPSGSFMEELKNRKGLLRSTNFGMRRCVRSHFKCVLADGEKLFVGSPNLTGAGMGMKGKNRRNFELGLMTDDDMLMDETAAYFNNIWSGERCSSCGRKKECVSPLEEPRLD